jgi:hypothetical protein
MAYGPRLLLRVGLCFILLGVVLFAQNNPLEKYVGFYEIAGEKPKDFAEFANFAILSFDGPHMDGRVIPNRGRVYEFSSAKLDNNEFQFHTRTLNGVAYDFTGRFLNAPPFPHDGRTPILEGVLKRLRNGEVAAEAKCQFAAVAAGGE